MSAYARIAYSLIAVTAIALPAVAQEPPVAAPPAAAAPAAQTIEGQQNSEVATVEETNGRVLLNRGTAYQPATKGQRLMGGDRLVVLEGGAITYRYDGTCAETIKTATVRTVRGDKVCEPALAERGLRTPAAGGTTGAGAAAGQYLKWGLVALGIAAPVYIIADNVQGSPISP